VTQVELLLSGPSSNWEFTSSRNLFTSSNSEIPTSEHSGTRHKAVQIRVPVTYLLSRLDETQLHQVQLVTMRNMGQARSAWKHRNWNCRTAILRYISVVHHRVTDRNPDAGTSTSNMGWGSLSEPAVRLLPAVSACSCEDTLSQADTTNNSITAVCLHMLTECTEYRIVRDLPHIHHEHPNLPTTFWKYTIKMVELIHVFRSYA